MGCESSSNHCHSKRSYDLLLIISVTIITISMLLHNTATLNTPYIIEFTTAVYELFTTMIWGILTGMLLVGVIGQIPREFVISILGQGGGVSGILRATLAGTLLDLCSHGILLIGMKLYERGASLGQVLAFLIASPWNSLTLTIILVSLIGLKWTLLFIVLSMVIAIITGLIAEYLVKQHKVPQNPNKIDLPKEFHFMQEARTRLKATRLNKTLLYNISKESFFGSQMILRWLLFGIILAATIRTFVDPEQFATYFGANLLGLLLTILAATIIEVCSEGSTPIAADLLTRANAPGNSFAFLMAGVSTDYTEIIALKETTKSWKIAFILPIITLPQILLVSYIITYLS